ncbi:RNA exonuclease 5 isoform X1 [Anolis sagrei]|uniref:RNA exonuclease 5 isoform X1 n=1 Tax=Anolis sagrei TaxID=38937 RepID=UPI0035219098
MTPEVVKSKRQCEDNENEEEPQKIKRKKKVVENELDQKEWKAITLSKVKKPHLSDALFGEECKISYDQLYEFLKYAALGKQHGATQSSWCRIHHRRRLCGVSVVVLCEVSQLHFYLFYLQFKFLRRMFRHHFSLPPASGDFMERLCGAGKKNHRQISSLDLEKDPVIQKYGNECRGLSGYILTPKEMCLHDYPIEGHDDCINFVCTPCKSPVTDSSPLFGLDCEMCLTEKGSELTRISVVDASGQCILDELVKPKLPIINYLTSYSGITEKLLLPVVTTLSDIQDQLKNLLPADAVLVGHSLNFDLRALEMVHPNVIDTSVLFARKRNKKFKLKFLAEAVLGKDIQRMDGTGHDPTEDALCALELAQYFINQGPRKVAEMNLEAQLLETRKIGEEQGCALPNPQNGVQKPTQSLLDILHFVGQKALLLGGWAEAASSNGQTQTGPQNKQILQRALEEVPTSSFSVIQFGLDSRHDTSDLIAKMRTKLANLQTIYAGPFGKDICLKPLKKIFKKYGHIQSIRIIPDTSEPHICIQYEVLEAAQLAVESLNRAEIGGSPVKVQRPVTESTLDCEMLLKELEKDADNESVIYLTGLRKTQREADLQQELGYLKDLASVFLPRDPRTGKSRNYCFLKFKTPQSAANALTAIEEHEAQGSDLRGRWALTPPHLHQWALQISATGSKLAEPPSGLEAHLQEAQPSFALEQEVQKQMKALDRKIKKLFQRLPNHTLCVILLPGSNRPSESHPGFGLMGIKGENPLLSSCAWC